METTGPRRISLDSLRERLNSRVHHTGITVFETLILRAEHHTRRDSIEPTIHEHFKLIERRHAEQEQNQGKVMLDLREIGTELVWTMAGLRQTITSCSLCDMSNRRTGDHFTRRAQQAGYAARSVFKLEEINQKHRLFQSGQRVLDLGCAPGSWLKYIAKKVGPRGVVFGIDRNPIQPLGPNVHALVGDIFEYPLSDIRELAGGLLDVVTSDMAPDTTGNRSTDHIRSVALCERALEIAVQLVKPRGAFVCKIFEGGEVQNFVAQMKTQFGQVKRMKPKSVRSESVELFLIGLNRKQEPHDGHTPDSESGDSRTT